MADPSGFRYAITSLLIVGRGRFRRDADLAASAPHDGRPWVDASMAGPQLINREGRAGGRCARPGRIRRRPHPRRENWPLDHIDERGGEAAKRKDKPVIVYCATPAIAPRRRRRR